MQRRVKVTTEEIEDLFEEYISERFEENESLEIWWKSIGNTILIAYRLIVHNHFNLFTCFDI